MGRGASTAIATFCALAAAACGPPANDGGDSKGIKVAVKTVAEAPPAEPHPWDPLFGLEGSEAVTGPRKPDCRAFPPAQGPDSVAGVRPGMTLPQATATLRCQFPDLIRGERSEIYYHPFAVGSPARRGFSVALPGRADRPHQQIDVYVAGGWDRERVFAIRTEAGYGDENRVPVEAVTAAVAAKYGPLTPGEFRSPPIDAGLGKPPDPFCMGFVGTSWLDPSGRNQRLERVDMPRLGACGTRLYYRTRSERDGLIVMMQLLLIDFGTARALYAEDLARAEQARSRQREAELRRARENAEKGAVPQL